jgi:Carboxypeptidase regulatory-like domain
MSHVKARAAGLCLCGLVIIDRYEAVRVTLPMRRFLIALAGLIICASFLQGQTQPGSETGIEGVITISPTKPGPIRADAPSSAPLANAAFVVENQTGEVTSFTTDDQGHFRRSLAPGHYKISLKGRKSSIGKFGPFEVDVVEGKMTKVEWHCDTGIR